MSAWKSRPAGRPRTPQLQPLVEFASALPEAGDVRQLHLWVRDQGIGLAPDELSELFRRYGRGRSARASGVDGLGLGLYLSHGFVAGHGGRMWAESDGPGRGTTVHVLLPRHAGVALNAD